MLSQPLKTYLTIFLIAICCLICVGVIKANNDTTNAQRFHQNVVKEIEESNMSDSVISACAVDAASNNYTLQMNKITDGQGETVMVEVILKYKYSIPVLNVLSNHEIRNYAR